MTVLAKYQRLECTGLWRETPQTQRREVLVSLGDASLVISDGRADQAITHWSLPAVRRLNPGAEPALFGPSADAVETLEIDDAAMIGAITTVHKALEGKRPREGRVRLYLLGGGLALVLAIGVWWVPEALVRHTATVIPFAKRLEIGRMVLVDLAATTGVPCAAPQAQGALNRLKDRLLPGDAQGTLIVLPQGLAAPLHLPGGIIALPRDRIERDDSPDVVAGQIIAERLRGETDDPLVPLLRRAGFLATFRLLTTGDLPSGAVAGYGAALLAAPAGTLPPEALLARFQAAGVPSSPYAYALDATGERTIALIEADPFRGMLAPGGVLPDTDWLRLQGICEG